MESTASFLCDELKGFYLLLKCEQVVGSEVPALANWLDKATLLALWQDCFGAGS
jgi:hypothetical protein